MRWLHETVIGTAGRAGSTGRQPGVDEAGPWVAGLPIEWGERPHRLSPLSRVVEGGVGPSEELIDGLVGFLLVEQQAEGL